MFKKLFTKSEPETTSFILFKGVFPKGYDLSKYRIYFISGFEVTENNISKLEAAYTQPDFLKVIMDLKYNSQSDNILIYYMENVEDSTGQLCLIIDPLEIFEKEQIVKRFDYKIDSSILSNYEKIN